MATNVAFEILYKEYYVRVFGLCRRLLGSAPLAEDATQETFMRADRRFGKYDSEQPFWQWISTIASNHCIDLLRQSGKGFGNEADELEALESSGPEALNQMIDAQDADVLNAAISELPEKYRVPLVLAYFNDASYEEIAAQLSLTRSHVGVLLLRGRQRLRQRLASEGFCA